MDKSLTAIDQVRAAVISQAVDFGPRLVVAAIITMAGYYVGNWIGRLVAHGLRKIELDPALSQLLVKLVRLLVLGLFAVLALQNLGVQLLPLIAGLGVAGAGVALAMQGLLSNLVAGLVIIFTHPFRVGEYISIVSVEGTVEEVSLFNTILSHPDLSRVVIPNRKIVGEILHNYGQIRQIQLAVRVAYDADLPAALAAIGEILRASPRILHEPAPLIQVSALEDSAVTIGVRPWVAVSDYVTASGEINQEILRVFRARKIVIPFPRQDVHLVRA